MNEPEHPLRGVFAEASGFADPDERSAFLDRVCGRDSLLRREVEGLLAAEAKAGKFLPDKPGATPCRAALERIAVATAAAFPIKTIAEKPGDRIGRYELLEKIGEGGCGVVYLARQETPVRRQVAVKIIKLGMDTRQVIARFEAERQALAIMDHPHIAKVFDAGVVGGWDNGAEVGDQGSEVKGQVAPRTAGPQVPALDPGLPTSDLRPPTFGSGRPYFVMELVRGSKITDYCNEHRLSTRQRLELFVQVCQAVQHAHQKGVIHRDLKPSNILVAVHDGVPVPKVIDFGIAKATEGKLTDETVFTAFEQFLGTPAYMSPEQAALTSVDVDTRSDIYSLGILLYELLTGATPFDTRALLKLGLDELRRTIRETEPPRPSTRLTQELLAADVKRRTSSSERGDSNSDSDGGSHWHLGKAKVLVQQLRGDLDWIVMKCLEKDRARRYETASGLAMDLTRHLNNEPVLARPPSRLYEFQKSVRRHKTGFAATVAVVAALSIGVIISSWEAARAARAEREAEAGSYTSDMNLCYQEWKDGKLANARALLSAHLPRPGQPDLRGFEWRYLWNLCQDESAHTVIVQADNFVRQLATTPAHNFVVAACEKTIQLLEPSSGRDLARLSYPNLEDTLTRPLVALAVGMTNLLAGHRANGVVSLWDLGSRQLLTTFRLFTNNASVLALSPNGQYLAASDQDGHGFFGTVLEVWDVSARPEPPHLVWSHPVEGGISAMTFNPGGEALVTARTSSKVVIETWETKTGQELKAIPNASAGNIAALSFSPDGTLLASAGVEGRINVWDFSKRTPRFPLDGHSQVGSLAFSRDGTQLYSGGDDGAIRRWDISARTSTGLWRLPRGGQVWMVVSPDGERIVSANYREVKIWDAEPRSESTLIKVGAGWSWPIVSPDGRKVIVSDPDDLEGSNGVAVWDIASGQHLFDLVPDGMVAKSMAFSPDGRLFVASSLWKDGRTGLWKTADWEKGLSRVQPFMYLTNGFESAFVTFSPDGKILAAAGLSFPPSAPREPSGATNRLAFWEVGSWRRLNLLPRAGAGGTEWQAAVSMDFSGNGRLVAVGSRDGWVRIWDFKTQRLLTERKAPFRGNNWGVVVRFSLDSRWLASFRPGCPGVDLWDIADPQHPSAAWLGQEETAAQYWAIFAQDNKTLVTASNDGLIKFWNLQTRRVALTVQHGHGPGGSLAMAPDGTFLVSKDASDAVKIWRAPSLEEIDRKRNVR